MPRSRAHPYRWDAWSKGTRIHSATAFTMQRAQAAAEAFFIQYNSPVVILQITTPNGTVYFLTHPGLKWLPQSSFKGPQHVRHPRP